MNLQRFIVILVMVVVMALMLVYQHARIIHAGYEMARLSRERDELTERQRKLAAEALELKRPDALAERVREFGMELVPVETREDVPVSAGWRYAGGR